MTPLALSILLHYYYSAEDFRQGDFTAPAVRDTINCHLYERLLENTQGNDGRTYCLSERGRVFIDHLLAQPLPVQVWQMPAAVASTDKCETCGGARGGVPGNENRVDGKLMCDYCHGDLIRTHGVKTPLENDRG